MLLTELLVDIAMWLRPEDALALAAVSTEMWKAVHPIVPRIIKENDGVAVGDRVFFTPRGWFSPFMVRLGVVEAWRNGSVIISDRYANLYKRSPRRVTRYRHFRTDVAFKGTPARFGMLRYACPFCHINHYRQGGVGPGPPGCVGGIGVMFEEFVQVV